jgi:hypothetical protein
VKTKTKPETSSFPYRGFEILVTPIAGSPEIRVKHPSLKHDVPCFDLPYAKAWMDRNHEALSKKSAMSKAEQQLAGGAPTSIQQDLEATLMKRMLA